MKIRNVFIASLLLILSCSTEDKKLEVSNDGSLILKEYFEDGNLKSIVTYNGDTILSGGFIQYYENGQIARKCFYEKGKLDGLDSIFYPSGNIRSERQWFDSTLIHDSYEFYDSLIPQLVLDGSDTVIMEFPIIKEYLYYNSNGVPGFSIKYNQNGDFLQSSGNSLVSIYFDSLAHNFDFILATPPGFTGILKISDSNSCDQEGRNFEYNVINSRSGFTISNYSSSCDYTFEINYVLESFDGERNILDAAIIRIENGRFRLERNDQSQLDI